MLRVLKAEHIKQALTPLEVIDVNEHAFIKLATKEAVVPNRLVIPLPEYQGTTLFKPAHISNGGGLGLKVVSVRPENDKRIPSLPTVPGCIMLFDEETAYPTGLLEATYLTALRTAAGSAAATRHLAKADAHVLLIMGAGAQGKAHIQLISQIRPIQQVLIWNRSFEKIDAFIKQIKIESPELQHIEFVAIDSESLSSAVSRADIIVTATNASTPVLKGLDLKDGTHINAVGAYRPDMQELDEETVVRSRVFVDSADALSAGDLAIPLNRGLIQDEHVSNDIGKLFAGLCSGRQSDQDVTLFKSVGSAVQDIATAQAVLKAAEARNLGQLIELL
eukprot:GILK01003933.1.p1 GENE.GILK01003933.1~~GILK01003933.1.p1  ORF type:complete len:334 (-),score=80.14 GILK01003933.1:141-1142(-)